jgi:single-strand DNA-binding protein
MASYNRVILMGNLTRDPELRYIPSGTAVTEITLAVNDRVKRNDQWTEETQYVDVTLWARTAEVVNEYLSKGSSILVEGRLKYDTWEKDGQKRSKLRVVADKMQMLGGRGGSPGGTSAGNGASSSEASHALSEASQEHAREQTPEPAGPPSSEIPF